MEVEKLLLDRRSALRWLSVGPGEVLQFSETSRHSEHRLLVPGHTQGAYVS